ncbi:hypothetical protein BC937DRAFT_92382 [Endogone sp. FLAS-F59071]|nr:hypothetical protein BC937DRAFT_92382 [Endogone sp. FLAS-F59071]|eukprot:RUS15489.1 hypothetical protein BC937DRAFT_92382 [Endogone sp. FLAS-F59071]
MKKLANIPPYFSLALVFALVFALASHSPTSLLIPHTAYDPNEQDDNPGASASAPPIPPPPYSPYSPNTTPSAPPSEHGSNSPHPPPSATNPLPYSPAFPHQGYGTVPVSSDADLPPPTNDPRLNFFFRPPPHANDPRMRFFYRPHPSSERRFPWGFHNPFGGSSGRPVHPHQGHFPHFHFPHMPPTSSTTPIPPTPPMPPMPHMPPMPDFGSGSPHDPLLGYHARGRGRGRGHGRGHGYYPYRDHWPPSNRRKPCCGNWCLYLCVGILIFMVLSRLFFNDKFDDGVGWDCQGDNGFRWEVIPDQILFTAKDTKSLKFLHTGALSSGRLTITRSLDSTSPYGTLTNKVTISSRALGKRMRYEFGIGQGASVYGYRFETPDRLEWDECIRAEFTLVVPRSWPDALLLNFDVRGFEILVHNLADEGKEEESGVKFDMLSLATTNYPITVEGSIVTKSGLWLSTTNAPIRVHGSLKSNNFLDVTSSNAALDLHATSSRIINLKTSNGKIVGNHTAFDSLQCQTSNDQINLQGARAPSIELKTTNAKLVAREVEIGNKLEATGSNGAIDVDIVRWFNGWSGEGVRVFAKSSNAPVKVTMPHDYRGSFSVSTSNNKAFVGFVPKKMEGVLPNSAFKSANTTLDLHWDVSRSNQKQGWKGEREEARTLGNIDVKTTSSKAEVLFRLE